MGIREVLDTSALISWPIESLEGGLIVEGQLKELGRVAPERLIIMDTAGLVCVQPMERYMQNASEISRKTGDIVGLSETDLALFAVTMQYEGHLHTDDYRLQNLCSEAGLHWSPVMTKGISESWMWEVRCPVCGLVVETSKGTKPASESIGNCVDCGSELKHRRRI
ncbi:MAG: hypothetical protein CMB02_05230 [Euryarchaeota archaeon]|nr:hypothetical protein [Euryarchaeota archaeon]